MKSWKKPIQNIFDGADVSEVCHDFLKYGMMENVHLKICELLNCKVKCLLERKERRWAISRKWIKNSCFQVTSKFVNLPSCVDDLLLPQRLLVSADRVCAVEQCVCLVCAAPRRSAHTPAKLRWRERRRRPQMSTPRRPDRQSYMWCLHGWLQGR